MIAIIFGGLVGACIGSFFNVVIYRLPRILASEKLTLSWPVSHCPKCKAKIRVCHNIPVISWIFLRGRCYGCRQSIHWRYPLVELMTATLFAVKIDQGGLTPHNMADLLNLSLLIPLFFIDMDTLLLPDRLTLPLLAFALVLSGTGYGRIELSAAVTAAGIGFGLPWLLSKLYSLRHGLPGMGAGDMKLFAGIGAWLGAEALFNIMLLASVLAMSVVFVFSWEKRHEGFPFGPYIIAATFMISLP